MMSDVWYYKELEIDLPSLNKSTMINGQETAITNLTNHKLYGKLCNWYDIEFIFNSTLLDHKSPGNYISRLYHLYLLYKAGFREGFYYFSKPNRPNNYTTSIEFYYNTINLYYNDLIKMKTKQIDIYILLNSLVNQLDIDIISVIKHYNNLLLL